MGETENLTAAEKYLLARATAVAQSAADVAVDLTAVKVRLEEHGRSIQDLRNRYEHPFVSVTRWVISLLLAFILGALLFGGP